MAYKELNLRMIDGPIIGHLSHRKQQILVGHMSPNETMKEVPKIAIDDLSPTINWWVES